MEQWYYDEKSEWTLDYPPFFPLMEYILGFFSKFVDKNITNAENLKYFNDSVLFYQRATVLIGDVLLLIVLKQ